jgi:hypothetical protein
MERRRRRNENTDARGHPCSAHAGAGRNFAGHDKSMRLPLPGPPERRIHEPVFRANSRGTQSQHPRPSLISDLVIWLFTGLQDTAAGRQWPPASCFIFILAGVILLPVAARLTSACAFEVSLTAGFPAPASARWFRNFSRHSAPEARSATGDPRTKNYRNSKVRQQRRWTMNSCFACEEVAL